MDDYQNRNIRNYWSLISLIIVSGLVAWALHPHVGGGMMGWMHVFMGFFLCVFALLKIFTPAGFADGFQMYDLLARRSRAYAFAYPYIELALGLGYLSFFQPVLVYAATVLVMGFGAIGVVTALRRGLNINCPCMGSILKVPLSTVTLTEDLAMGGMALVMLVIMIL